MRRHAWTAAALAVASMALAAPLGSAAPWDGDQPRVSEPVPAPAPDGAYYHDDFDGDGVANVDDNCVLVANADQAPAVVPPGAVEDPLAVEWDAQHPDTPFRLNSELGEACSAYNDNYRHTFEAIRQSSHERKIELLAFLAESGPMFGWDRLALSIPHCSNWRELASLPSRILGLPVDLLDQLADAAPAEFDCATGEFLQQVENMGMQHVWAGKRLYTDADGGRIVNRFFPFITEHPAFAPVADAFPQVFPYGNGQTIHGVVMRGQSIVDGRETIILDWRDAFPANIGLGGYGYLVYDECRAVHTGLYHCFAWTDIVSPLGERSIWREGWMPFDLINPSIDEYLAWREAQGD
ncbi:MAG: thrombospondin type 3 repeat-containing protein [Acidimicrobiales bacterium]